MFISWGYDAEPVAQRLRAPDWVIAGFQRITSVPVVFRYAVRRRDFLTTFGQCVSTPHFGVGISLDVGAPILAFALSFDFRELTGITCSTAVPSYENFEVRPTAAQGVAITSTVLNLIDSRCLRG